MPQPKPPLTVRETAKRLNQNPGTISAMCRRGEFKGAYKIGLQGRTSHWRIPAAAIDRYETLRGA